MGLLNDDTRANMRQNIINLRNQYNAAFDRIIAIKASLTSARSTVNSDATGAQVTFQTDDVTDIDTLLNEIQTRKSEF